MNTQQPAIGIAQLTDTNNSQSFVTICDCSDTEHSVHTWIETEPDNDLKMITVTFYTSKNLSLKERIVKAYNLIFSKTFVVDQEIILNKQTALNWASAIANSVTSFSIPSNKIKFF